MNESIRLLSTKDGADKEYRVQLEAKDGDYCAARPADSSLPYRRNGQRKLPLQEQFNQGYQGGED